MMGMTDISGDDGNNRDSSDGCSCDVVLGMLGAVVEVTVAVSCGSCGCDGSDGGGDSGDNRDDGGDGDGAEDVLVAPSVLAVVDGSADGSGNI